ncbi:MAG: hypothetical protein ACKV2Q_26045 [Planctomycetaceae bacterium]
MNSAAPTSAPPWLNAISEWLRFDGTLVIELYDSVVLPGVRQSMAVGFKTTEIERLMLVEDEENRRASAVGFTQLPNTSFRLPDILSDAPSGLRRGCCRSSDV